MADFALDFCQETGFLPLFFGATPRFIKETRFLTPGVGLLPFQETAMVGDAHPTTCEKTVVLVTGHWSLK